MQNYASFSPNFINTFQVLCFAFVNIFTSSSACFQSTLFLLGKNSFCRKKENNSFTSDFATHDKSQFSDFLRIFRLLLSKMRFCPSHFKPISPLSFYSCSVRFALLNLFISLQYKNLNRKKSLKLVVPYTTQRFLLIRFEISSLLPLSKCWLCTRVSAACSFVQKKVRAFSKYSLSKHPSKYVCVTVTGSEFFFVRFGFFLIIFQGEYVNMNV